jgi:uncharacterized coiled-coil DUF342 family protein
MCLTFQIANINEDIARMSSYMPSVEDGMMELAVANQVSDKWKVLDASETNAKAAVEKVSTEVDELKKILENYHRDSVSTAKKLEEYSREADRVQQIIEGREEGIRDLSRFLVAKDQERETLMEQVLLERAKLPVLSAAIAAARAKLFDAQENSIFESQMNVLDSEADGLNDSIAAVCAEVVSLQAMLNSYIEDRVDMENELQRLEDAHSALTENVEDAVCWFQSPHNLRCDSDVGTGKTVATSKSAFEIQLVETSNTGPASPKSTVEMSSFTVSVCDDAGDSPQLVESVPRKIMEVGKLTEEELKVGRNDEVSVFHKDDDHFTVNVTQMVRSFCYESCW